MRTMGGGAVRGAMAGARWRQGGTWAPACPAPSRKGQALKSACAIEGREARVESPSPARRRMKSAPPQRRRSPLRGACPRATRPASRWREAVITLSRDIRPARPPIATTVYRECRRKPCRLPNVQGRAADKQPRLERHPPRRPSWRPASAAASPLPRSFSS